MTKYEVVKDKGQWFVMKGERVVTAGFASKELAQRWVNRLTGKSPGYYDGQRS